MKRSKYIIAFLFLAISAFSQPLDTASKKKNIVTSGFAVDSIEELIRFSGEDSDRVNLYFTLGRQYEYFNSKERIDFFAIALSYAKKLNNKNQIKRMSSALITNLFHRKMYDIAMSYCLEYLNFLEEEGFQEEIPEMYKMYANLLSKQGNYRDASLYYHLAKDYYLTKNDLGSYASTLNSLSLMLMETNRADSALLYCMRALDIFQRQNSGSAYANSVLGIAEIYLMKNDVLNAKRKALQSYDLYANGVRDEHGVANSLLVLGKIYLKDGNADSSLTCFNKALIHNYQLNFIHLKRDCAEGMSKAYVLQKNFEEALNQQILFKNYSDTISLNTLRGKMTEMEVKYDIKAKESELQEKNDEIVAQSRQRNYLIIIVVVVLILFIISFRAYSQKRKANVVISEQKKLVEEKQKEIVDSIKYAKRIQNALITSEKYVDKTLNRLDNK